MQISKILIVKINLDCKLASKNKSTNIAYLRDQKIPNK